MLEDVIREEINNYRQIKVVIENRKKGGMREQNLKF